MKKILAVLSIAFMTVFASGCTTLSNVADNDLVVQYSTAKVIQESDSIDSQDVIDAVTKARGVLDADADVTIAELKLRVADKIGWETIDPVDRMLILAVVNEVESNLKERVDLDLISDETEFKIREFLDTVESAAVLVGDTE